MKTLLALGVGSVFLFRSPAAALSAVRLDWNMEDHSPSLQNFASLCAFITLHDDMPPKAIQAIYDVLSDEPHGKDHMTRLHRKISAAMPAKNKTAPRAPLTDDVWKLDEHEKWFARHILTACYSGIYHNSERPAQRIIYQDALMFRTLQGIAPTPLADPMGFGAWAEAPE